MDTKTRSEEDLWFREHEPFIKTLARRLMGQFGLHCELDDLVTLGMTGLWQARERFDAARGVQFKTFAYYRVRGAMMDGIRKMAYAPRRYHTQLRALQATDVALEELNETSQTTSHSAEPRDAAVEALESIQQALNQFAVAFTAAEALQNDEHPETLLMDAAARDKIRKAIETLPEQEKALMFGLYYEDKTLEELASQIGISKSWACRLHGRSLNKLKGLIETED